MRWWGLVIVAAALLQQAPDVRIDDEFWRARLAGLKSIELPRSFDAAYLDLIELALYNGTLSPLANPLAFEQNKAPLDLSCCASESRVDPSRLTYSTVDDTIYVGLFAASEALLRVGATPVRITQRTRYPWDGEFEFRVEPDTTATFAMAIRIPAWTRGQAVPSDRYQFHEADVRAPTLLVNGQTTRVKLDRGFAHFSREWRRGDVVHLYFPMPIQRVITPAVPENRGRVAIQRGPLIYAFEPSDARTPITSLRLPSDAEVIESFKKDVAGGAIILTAPALIGTPYYARANPSVDSVWLRQ